MQVDIVVYHLQHLLTFMQRSFQIQLAEKSQESNIGDCAEEASQKLKDQACFSKQMIKCGKQKPLKQYISSNKPKRSISSFSFYFRQQLQRREHPSFQKQVGKLTKIISEEWKSLSEQAKQPYHKMAEQSKRTYEQNMNHYNIVKSQELNQSQKADKAADIKQECSKRRRKFQDGLIRRKYKKHKQKQPEVDIGINEPKVPLSSFFIFFKENTPRLSRLYQENRRPKLVQLASVEWSQLSKQQKQKYKIIAKAHKETYENELAVYKSRVKQFLKNQAENNVNTAYQPQTIDNSLKNETYAQDMVKIQNHHESKSGKCERQPDSLGEDISPLSSSFIGEQELSSNQSYIQESITKPPLKDQTQPLPKDILQKQSPKKEQTQRIPSTTQKWSKRGKRSRQIHQPKGPISSFFLYYNCVVRELNKEYPNLKGSELVKIASERWAMFSQSQKQIYQQEARRGRELYEVQMDKFKKDYPEEASKLKYFQSKKDK